MAVVSAGHTPGPWISKGLDRAEWVDIVRIEDDGFESVPFAACKHFDQEANARLIVSAPEMLQALQLAKNSLVAFKFMPGPGNAWEDHDEANLQAVDAAIAKATQAQP